MKKSRFLFVFFIFALFNYSCEKTGPQGPLGPTGANGVANISSTIFDIQISYWDYVANDYLATITDTAITNPTTDGIEVFYSINSVDWFCLPQTGIWAGSDVMEFAYKKDQLTLYYKYYATPATSIAVKIVVIPPAVMKQHPNANWHNYNQVITLTRDLGAFKN